MNFRKYVLRALGRLKSLAIVAFIVTGTIPAPAAFPLACPVARLTQEYAIDRARIAGLQATGVVKDGPACKKAVDTAGDLAKAIMGDVSVIDVSKQIANCACDDAFSGDDRLKRLIDAPGSRSLIVPGVYYVRPAAAQGACWDRQNRTSSDLTILNSCNNGSAQDVEIGHVGNSPWYYLMVAGACANVHESSWNGTGEQIHLLPCTFGANDNDSWAIVANPSEPSQLMFINKRSAGCLDRRTQNPRIVQQNICTELGEQRWTLTYLREAPEPRAFGSVVTVVAKNFDANQSRNVGTTPKYGPNLIHNFPPQQDHPNKAVYRFGRSVSSASGEYTLSVCYAAAEPRPFKVTLNGTVIPTKAGEIKTGGWFEGDVRCIPHGGPVPLQNDNTLVLERDHMFPHIKWITFHPR